MSLPAELRTWVSCPGCGETDDLVRLNPLKRTKNGMIVAGKKVKCRKCGTVFETEMGTRKENMGMDYGAGEVSV